MPNHSAAVNRSHVAAAAKSSTTPILSGCSKDVSVTRDVTTPASLGDAVGGSIFNAADDPVAATTAATVSQDSGSMS